MFRSLFTVVGILSVFAVFFFFIKPDWVKQIYSTPTASGPLTSIKVTARIPLDKLAAKETPKDKSQFILVDPLPNGDDVSAKIVEDVGDDLPSRSTPYLLIVNKTNNTMRYCRLSPHVKKIALRGMVSPEVKLNEMPASGGAPYQAILWVPTAVELLLEFELSLASPARS